MPTLSPTPPSTTSPSFTLLLILSVVFAGGFLFFQGSKNHIREHAINPSWPLTDPIFSDTLGWNSEEFHRGFKRYTEDLMKEYTLLLIFRAPFIAVYAFFGFLLLDWYLIEPVRHNMGFKFGLDIVSTQLVFSILPKFDPTIGLLGATLFSILSLGFLHQISFNRGVYHSIAAYQSAIGSLFVPVAIFALVGFLFFGWASGRSKDPVLKGSIYATILSLPLFAAAVDVLESVSIIFLLYSLPVVHPLIANLGGMLGIVKHACMYTAVIAVIFGLSRNLWLATFGGAITERKTN
eukprot:TRINITY_DN10518_c0_g1_i1.p1 TRINITY_DN10518_c0_g1~~TRINITY_DN10518_c0_g1_i1.p1  ORF type:complete len:315 (-),score=66.22 TRINITY_DN10518_c0_g1_i1:210-1088(-)